ncbi:hypothetical protein SCALIN_C25_0014 [Candidatus Scalindua japonica]|uniref:Uncharacterized protein n=1 Tax=Candidatus Scalindua japonica TaxID=1284222 RepID=A0A286U0A9_9BACT|nr:hypothetical protein [Candidatus Scalindua japonica]GAX61567.1 hypothetical protein SCALIN_C25_0014 [Candidatus Scalindua japonica]
MSNQRHKDDSKPFEKLTCEEQAHSINATIINLHNKIKRHVKDSPDPIKTLEKCIEQISGLHQQLIKEEETYGTPKQ